MTLKIAGETVLYLSLKAWVFILIFLVIYFLFKIFKDNGGVVEMNIQQATKIALEENKFITRESCDNWKIKPTDTYECCVFILLYEPIKSAPRWNPEASDLIANDWKVVD